MQLITRTRTLVGAGLIGATALLGACAPPTVTVPAPPDPPGSINTLTDVPYQCNGAGASSGSNAAAQTVNVRINHPASVAAGAAYAVTVTVPTLNLVAAPPFLDLNGIGITSTIAMSADNGTINPAGPAAVYFYGNGLSGTVAPAPAGGVAGAPGTINGTAGTILILSTGGSGFVCAPILPSTGALYQITVV